ncbi:hypothetical protein RJG79_07810 [Mycoplasmatota bacterium WC44]
MSKSLILLLLLLIFNLQGCVEQPVKGDYYKICNIDETIKENSGEGKSYVVKHKFEQVRIYEQYENVTSIIISYVEDGVTRTKAFFIDDVVFDCHND